MGMSCCCCDDQGGHRMDEETLSSLKREYIEYKNDVDSEQYIEFVTQFCDGLGTNERTISYRNACDYVRNCREIICPNEAFATQLAEFEESLRNGVSTYTKCQAWNVNGITPTRCYDYKDTQ